MNPKYITQADFARAVGVTATTVVNWRKKGLIEFDQYGKNPQIVNSRENIETGKKLASANIKYRNKEGKENIYNDIDTSDLDKTNPDDKAIIFEIGANLMRLRQKSKTKYTMEDRIIRVRKQWEAKTKVN